MCFLEFILRPILELFWAIFALWVPQTPQRSDLGRLPSVHRDLQNELLKHMFSLNYFKTYLGPILGYFRPLGAPNIPKE